MDLKLSCEQIRMKNREAYRAEQYLPKVKWAAFQEQRRHEDFAAIRFEQKQASIQVKKDRPDLRIVDFCQRLRRHLDKRVRELGGTESSVLRTAFLDWDGDCSGALSVREFKRAVESLGFVVADDEASYVVGYYGADSGGEMRYATFVEDVARLGRHLMEHSDVGAATARSGAGDRSGHPAIVRRFIKKLRAKLLTSIKKNGEYERILIRRAFLNWDADVGPARRAELPARWPNWARANLKSTTAPTPEEEHEDELLLESLFTCRPYEKTQNALAEEFKVKLRYAVEARILSQGGTVQSILREASSSGTRTPGELNVREFMGAMNRVGMDMSEMHARQIVRYYDRKGNRAAGDGEIHYMDLVDEIAKATRAAKGGQPIPPRDLLHGTLLRIDKAGSGAATAKDLARLARELHAPLNDRELRELVTWYDVSGSNTLPYAALVEDCFPRGAKASGYAGAAPLPMISASAPPTPSSGMSTSRRKMAKINAEKATIEKRLRQLQEQQKAQKA
ncbi:hypothetical protein JL722_14043 [Aureococcus anophagefferens]|nr:hypothetical protein JL722_14043 [Aureococcus anophagefferens]